MLLSFSRLRYGSLAVRLAAFSLAWHALREHSAQQQFRVAAFRCGRSRLISPSCDTAEAITRDALFALCALWEGITHGLSLGFCSKHGFHYRPLMRSRWGLYWYFATRNKDKFSLSPIFLDFTVERYITGSRTWLRCRACSQLALGRWHLLLRLPRLLPSAPSSRYMTT